jgi:hypothetical protein
LKRETIIVAWWAALLVACDVTLRFAADGGDDGGLAAQGDSTAHDACQGAGCDAAACEGGSCTCSAPTSDCSGACVNLKSDHNHCGQCAIVCVNGEHCSSGVCVVGSGKDTGP